MRAVIFLGPSLPLDQARQLLPEAIYLPPAKQADLLSALTTYDPDVIGLIDGTFGESLAVWHKEILFALDQGVQVLGAASMGALRAAELDAFGMRGVGEIYRSYRDGKIDADDEVALLHASAEGGFLPLTLPLVNVRATLAHAAECGLLAPAERDAVVDLARRLHFSERTLDTLIQTTAAARGSELARRIRDVFTSAYLDLKAADARLLLETIRDLPKPVTVAPRYGFVRSRAFERLYNADRIVRAAGNEPLDVPLREIAAWAALNLPDFDELNFAALNRALALVLAEVLHMVPTPDEVAAQRLRFRRELGLDDESTVADWLRRNNLTASDLEHLVYERATCRRLHRWLLATPRQAHHSRWLLDELRVRGRYAAAATAAADELARRRRADGLEHASLAELDETAMLDLVLSHQRATGWRPTAPLDEGAQEAGFNDAKDLAYELLWARRCREANDSDGRAD